MNQTAPPASWVRLNLLPASVVAGYTLSSAVAIFWLPVFFADDLGFTGAQIGLLYAFNSVAGVLAALPAGLGNDRLTSRVLVMVALSVQALTFFLLRDVHAFGLVAGVFFLWSMTNALFRISMEMQMLKTDTGEQTGRRVGMFVSWRFMGMLVGTIAGGYVLQRAGFTHAFLLAGIACLFMLVPAGFLPPTQLAKATWRDYFRDLKNWRVVLFTGWLFLFTTHWGVESTCYGLFLKHGLSLDPRQMGFYMSAEFVAVAVAATWLPRRLSRHASLVPIGIGGLLLSGIGHIGMVSANVWVSVAFRAMHGFGDGALMLLMYLGFARLFNITRLGGNAGAINLAMMGGQIAGAMIAAPVGDAFNYGLPIWVSGVLLIALSVPLIGKAWLNQRAAHC
jgi:predicted MFS family arabinose efflux permease